MEQQEFEALRKRLDRVERRLRVAVVGWVVSIATVVVLGVAVQQAVSQPEVLRARSFEVVDAAGRVRIALAVGRDGSSGLGLYDVAGRVRGVLSVLPDGSPGLGLYDAAGQARIGLGLLPDESPWLSLLDAAERERIALDVFPDGSPMLTLKDAAGRVLFRAP